jgi:hypothetical protein
VVLLRISAGAVEELGEEFLDSCTSRLVKAISGSLSCEGFGLPERRAGLILSWDGVEPLGGGARIMACSRKDSL